jgi:hypothetical protein
MGKDSLSSKPTKKHGRYRVWGSTALWEKVRHEPLLRFGLLLFYTVMIVNKKKKGGPNEPPCIKVGGA